MEQGICDWLRGYLRDAPREVGEVRAAAKAAGYTRAQLKEARRMLGIWTTNNWEKDHPETSRWFWQLPGEQAAPGVAEKQAGRL